MSRLFQISDNYPNRRGGGGGGGGRGAIIIGSVVVKLFVLNNAFCFCFVKAEIIVGTSGYEEQRRN